MNEDTDNHIDFLKFIAGEEQNLLTTLINLRPDFDVFSHLDDLYRGPVDFLDVSIGEEVIPSLYLFVHYHFYLSVASLSRAHLSECLASTRKAMDASFSAYEMLLHPETIKLYKNQDKKFQFIKGTIAKERKADESTYPLAANLLELHEICSEFGSHADISTFTHRVEVRETDNPKKKKLMFKYYQFPSDKEEYHAYFVETLLAYYEMLLIFKPMLLEKAVGLDAGWDAEVASVGTVLEAERNTVFTYFERMRESDGAT